MKSQEQNRAVQPLTKDIVDKFLTNQGKELQLKTQELEFQKQKDNHAFQFASESLKAKMQVHGADRTHQQRILTIQACTVAFLALTVGGIVTAAIFKGMETIAIEVVKAVAYIATGALGGYGYGRIGSRDKAQDKDG